MSHTCEATFGVPGRGGKGRGGARESRKRGVATDARGLPAFQVLDEIAPPARQVGVNHGAALDEQPTDAAALLYLAAVFAPKGVLTLSNYACNQWSYGDSNS